MMNRWSLKLAALILLLGVLLPYMTSLQNVQAAPSAAADAVLRQQVDSWRLALSQQAEFSSWKKASSSIQPLGPGTHSWLVTLELSGKAVGYMIVEPLESGGYALGEYGAGSYPLYSSLVLQRKLKEQNVAAAERTRLYASPTSAVWRIVSSDREILYADAWTGDILPISDKDWTLHARNLGNGSESAFDSAQDKKTTPPLSVAAPAAISAITASADLPAASATAPAEAKSVIAYANSLHASDPLERLSWLLAAPIAKPTSSSLSSILKSGRPMDYTAELYDGKVLQIWQAAGLHRWTNGRAYASFVNSESTAKRYILLDQALVAGKFYRV